MYNVTKWPKVYCKMCLVGRTQCSQRCLSSWASKNDREGASSQRQSPTGLEPAISRFVGGCLIHWATGTLLIPCSTLDSHPQLLPFQLQRLTATIPGHTRTFPAVVSCVTYSVKDEYHSKQDVSGQLNTYPEQNASFRHVREVAIDSFTFESSLRC